VSLPKTGSGEPMAADPRAALSFILGSLLMLAGVIIRWRGKRFTLAHR
jgi:hypothetical protein